MTDKITEFVLSPDDIDKYFEQLCKWGDRNELEPTELCCVLALVSNILREHLGITITHREETTKVSN